MFKKLTLFTNLSQEFNSGGYFKREDSRYFKKETNIILSQFSTLIEKI